MSSSKEGKGKKTGWLKGHNPFAKKKKPYPALVFEMEPHEIIPVEQALRDHSYFPSLIAINNTLKAGNTNTDAPLDTRLIFDPMRLKEKAAQSEKHRFEIERDKDGQAVKISVYQGTERLETTKIDPPTFLVDELDNPIIDLKQAQQMIKGSTPIFRQDQASAQDGRPASESTTPIRRSHDPLPPVPGPEGASVQDLSAVASAHGEPVLVRIHTSNVARAEGAKSNGNANNPIYHNLQEAQAVARADEAIYGNVATVRAAAMAIYGNTTPPTTLVTRSGDLYENVTDVRAAGSLTYQNSQDVRPDVVQGGNEGLYENVLKVPAAQSPSAASAKQEVEKPPIYKEVTRTDSPPALPPPCNAAQEAAVQIGEADLYASPAPDGKAVAATKAKPLELAGAGNLPKSSALKR